MLIRDEIEKQGYVLFRYRSYVPLLLIPLMLLALQNAEWIEFRFGDFIDDVYDWLCIMVSMTGVALRVATVGFAPRRTSGRNTKGQIADELNTTGMYSIVRHPLYLANGIILLGLLLVTESFLYASAGLAIYFVIYERIACCEESFLLKRFGSQYRAWADRTPAALPQIRLWTPPALPFSWRTALKREYLTGFGVITGFTFIDYAEDLIAYGRLEFESKETILFVCALFVFLIVRYLRKKTNVLRVAGR